MQDISDLLENRTFLEKNIIDLNLSKELQLSTYDIMVTSRLQYVSRLNSGLDSISDLMDNLKDLEPNALSAKYRFKSELIRMIREFGHAPAYIFVLNYDSILHATHVFGGNYERACVNRKITDVDIRSDLLKIAYEDNAILVNSQGIIVVTNAKLVNINPALIQDSSSPDPSLGELEFHNSFGFSSRVSSRHYSALGASYHLAGSIVFSLSEETGVIRRFENGKINFSTLPEEALL